MKTAPWPGRRAGNGPLRTLALATLVSNIAIVVTGGAVRLTGSGLGCPTWPRCTQRSFVPHGELGMHGAIEFGNRMMTFVLAAIAIATWVAAVRARPRRRSVRVLATVLALGIPGQALIGGVTVLTDLNPWVVSLHLMLSMAMVALAVLLVREVGQGGPLVVPRVHAALRRLTVAIMGATFVVLYLGTVVTGAGPHAGHLQPTDLEGNRVLVVRNGLDAQVVSHVHAASVYLLVGLTLVALLVASRTGAPRDVRRAALTLLAVEAAQATVGFTQYFLDLPILLVGIHLLGAALLTAAATWLLVSTRRATDPQSAPHRDAGSSQAVPS
ncbi:MAG: COX15/CtaA family protein [Actinomycetota bacterium]|nr:COX15/CtaA family protein [Actinomycetota bacterium]